MMRKILVISPGWVGDTVMAQVLFELIKQQHPDVCIDVLAPAWARDLLSLMPQVNHVYLSPFGHGQLQIKERYQLAKTFRNKGYDQAILLPNSFKSALIPFFAHIPKRTGWLGEMRWGILNDHRKLDKKKYPLMIERFAALGFPKEATLPANLPWPRLSLSSEEQTIILEKFNLSNIAKPILAICPGAEYGPAKRWPSKYYADIVKTKQHEGWQVWIMGSAKDHVVAEEIQQASGGGAIDFTGKTNLKEAIYLLNASDLVLTNDSGLMHIAAALDKSIVALYGSSSPGFTPPLSKKVQILSLNLPCSPCFERECPLGHFKCMLEMSPSLVLEKIKVGT